MLSWVHFHGCQISNNLSLLRSSEPRRYMDSAEYKYPLPFLDTLHYQQGNILLHQIVVGNVFWCYHFEPESKRQSVQ